MNTLNQDNLQILQILNTKIVTNNNFGENTNLYRERMEEQFVTVTVPKMLSECSANSTVQNEAH